MTSRSTQRASASVVALFAVVSLVLTGCSSKTTQAPLSAGEAAGGQASVALELSESTSDFAQYLRQQTEQLDTGTAEFAAAYQSGDDELARSLYAPTRMFFNRLLAAQALFPELAAQLDARQADVAAGASFTGWHAIENDLYAAPGQTPNTPEQRASLATALTTDTHALVQKLQTLRPTADEQTDGAARLMQTLAVNAVNGTQDAASGSDISDLQGYVDGAHLVFEGIRVVLVTQDAALATRLDHQFGAIQDSLNGLRTGVEFPTYSHVSASDLTSLRGQVDSLGAALAKVTSAMAPATASPSPAP